ncbi:hydrophobin [Crassisporium funariophilum]|nr:hydrophobin [Crassisporium funariophilum]
MFSNPTALFVAAFAVLTVSAQTYSCNTGPVQCCNDLKQAGSYDAQSVAALVGVAVASLTGQAGFECSPITGAGVGSGANCAAGPVCCERNSVNQLVGVNCTPATVLV